jgi:hypothetical protein
MAENDRARNVTNRNRIYRIFDGIHKELNLNLNSKETQEIL